MQRYRVSVFLSTFPGWSTAREQDHFFMAFLYKQAIFIKVAHFIQRPAINNDTMLVQAKFTQGGFGAVAMHMKPHQLTFSAID